MVSELVGATLTWGGIGWLADRWLNTDPIFISIGFLIGFAAGFYLLWARHTGHITPRTVRSRQTAPAASEDTPPTTTESR